MVSERLFFWGIFPGNFPLTFGLFPREGASGVLREALLRQRTMAPLGILLSLYDKEDLVCWWGPTHRFHSTDTGGAERIEPHAVLPGYKVLRELDL
jgi:hypothetical protein